LLDGITKEFADSFEKTSALRRMIASDPKLKEMCADDIGFEP
jgi:hypothetical protein